MSNWNMFREELLQDSVFRGYCEDMAPFDDIAKAIIGGRLKNDWTQKDLAMHAGVTQADVSRYENGDKFPTIKTLQKIGNALGCTVRISFEEKELL